MTNNIFQSSSEAIELNQNLSTVSTIICKMRQWNELVENVTSRQFNTTAAACWKEFLIEMFFPSMIQVHGSVGEPWWLWVEDPINDHIYHSEYFLLQKKQVFFFKSWTLIGMRTVFLVEYMVIDVCSSFLYLYECMCVFLPPGGNRRASAHSVHHPHLWALALAILHQGSVWPLARGRGCLHHQLPEPHLTRETPPTHRYTHPHSNTHLWRDDRDLTWLEFKILILRGSCR